MLAEEVAVGAMPIPVALAARAAVVLEMADRQPRTQLAALQILAAAAVVIAATLAGFMVAMVVQAL